MNEPDDPALEPSDEAAPDSSKLPKIIHAQELFAGEREVLIEHDGATYRLRLTRRNKLILQK